MDIPEELREALQLQIEGVKQNQMVNDAQAISMRYRTESGKGQRLLTSDSEAAAYAAARMPATFGAVSSALEHAFISYGCNPATLLDVGAGTGAVSWAADQELNLKSIVCLEREKAMMKIGRAMMENGSQVLRNAEWIHHDLTKDKISTEADLVVASYVLNEMTEENRMKLVTELWKATKIMLLLIEPGTPIGFSNLEKCRELLLGYGAHIAAPCMQEGQCPKNQEDWCHFVCRISRSSLQRQLKGGDAPYEDEKFMYLAVVRDKLAYNGARILRHPQVSKGCVMMEVCSGSGVEKIKFSKRDGDMYKRARKLKAGDEIPFQKTTDTKEL